MCASSERRRLKEEFEKLLDDVDKMEKKQKKLEEFLNIEYVEDGSVYKKKPLFGKKSK